MHTNAHTHPRFLQFSVLLLKCLFCVSAPLPNNSEEVSAAKALLHRLTLKQQLQGILKKADTGHVHGSLIREATVWLKAQIV